MGDTKIGGKTHEVRVGMSVYWAETTPEMRLVNDDPTRGHRYSAIDGKVGGWCAGTRSQALKELREALLAREALLRVVVKQDAAAPPEAGAGGGPARRGDFSC